MRSEINRPDVFWMQKALQLAKHAEEQGEVPVGAVLVANDEIIGQGWNQSISINDPTAHAEIIALRAGANALANYRLPETTLYVTLEPCAMCAGAMIHSRVQRLVFGAFDLRAGAVTSVFNILESGKLNHNIVVCCGVLAEESKTMLQTFFRARR